MRKKSQKDKVLELLQAGKTITSFEAFQLFNITRLSSVIFDLRQDGHSIISEDVTVESPNWGKTSIARYKLIPQKPKQKVLFRTG